MEIYKKTIAEAWEASIYEVVKCYLEKGELILTERDTTSIEIENMMIHIAEPMSEPRHSSIHPNPSYLEAYSKNILDFKYQKDVYSRIVKTGFGETNINQLDKAINLLKSNWYTTKAIITVFDPYIDTDSEHPPCTCLLQFLIRNKHLNLTSYFRSNDAWLCAHGDMLAMTNLQKKVADELEIEIGSYTHIAGCYHIYEYDIFAAYEKLKNVKRNT